MARNGSGTYSLAAGNPVVTGTTISSTTHNNTMSDIATALTDSLAKDGQTTPTADLPMGTYKHTGVGNAAARNQYAAVGQAQDQSFTWCSTAGGTADVFTLTPSPAITAYAAGQAFVFLAVGTNTTNVTCNVSGVGAKAVQASGSALAGGEIVSGKLYVVRYDGTQFQLETVSVTPFIATLLNDTSAAAARTTLGVATASALVHRNAAGLSVVTSTITPIPFTTEVYDDAAIHDNAVNTERLTVPAGYTWAKLTGCINFSNNATGERQVFFRQNGAAFAGAGDDIRNGNTVPGSLTMNIVSAKVPVVAGDYFTLNVYQTSGGNLNLSGATETTWFCIELFQ